MNFEIIPSYNIDKSKWDDCIGNSTNSLIYASSLYLDIICDNWHGIILNDYEAVMPIVWRKKYGIKYCYHAPFIQQLGWFGLQVKDDSNLFLTQLFDFCNYGDYSFNYNNIIEARGIEQSSNYIIDLSKTYHTISGGYKQDLLNNLKKAQKEEFYYTDEPVETGIEMYKNLYSKRTPHVTEKDYQNFNRLCKILSQDNYCFARKVINNKNEILAIGLLLKDKKRVYNVMNSTTEMGRKTEANHFLFNCIFEEFAESNLIFDFEGSDLPGVKNFYRKFGAVEQPFYKIHFNKLPFPINFLTR